MRSPILMALPALALLAACGTNPTQRALSGAGIGAGAGALGAALIHGNPITGAAIGAAAGAIGGASMDESNDLD